MFYAIYETATGKLKSVGSVVDSPLPGGLTKKSIGTSAPDLSKVEWNSTTLTFDPLPLPSVILSRFEFRQRLTISERVGLDNLTENTVLSLADKQMAISLMKDLDSALYVKLDDPLLISGLNYLESVGLIGAGRSATIRGVI